MSGLPDGWSHFSLKDLGGLSGGKTPSKANPEFWSSPDVPWVSPKDMKRKLLVDAEDRISQLAVEDAGMTLYPASSVLMVTRSGILQHTFPVALAGAELTVNQDIKVLRPVEGITPQFAFYLLKSFGGEILSACSKDGTTVQSIDSEKLEAFPFPLPPAAEQTRIAAKLDELLAQVDTLKARIDGIPALLKRFRQSVLAAAVSGRLTEEWRAVNSTASPILIDDLKKAWTYIYRSQGRKYKEPDLLPGELESSLPDSWVEAKVGEVFDVHVGATPSRENDEFWGGTIPWVSSSEVAFCRIKGTRESISEAGYKSASTTIHPPGTVMLAMIGQGKTRGQPAILDIDACHNQNTAAIRVHPSFCSSEYLYYYLYERYEETRRVGSGNNQQALNKKAVQSLPFPLPPLAEQTEIVRRVEQLFAFADQLEARLKAAQARIDRLTQSILAKAFRGELVPQDPNDEPASMLLERIKAQRAAVPKAKRGRRAATLG